MNRKKLWFSVLMICFFLAASVVIVTTKTGKPRSTFHSSRLTKSVTVNENAERTDYLDSGGRITIAADLGYATAVKTRKENGVLEQYYDDLGDPISRYNGYYAELQEYDDKGNNIRTTYLDASGEPVITANGYAAETREFNDSRQVVSVRYTGTGGEPIQTPSYGFGKNQEYNEDGKISRITYVDASGNPVMTGLGYAIVTRDYYIADRPENGRVKSEFYFDAAGNPVSLSLGQYGVRKAYDEYGRVSVLTYLDAHEEPAAAGRGYTTVVRTYLANNNVASEQYYDSEGNPVSLAEGQYGFRTDGSRTVYLDRDGNEQFNLKNLVFNHPWIVIPAAIAIILLASVAGKKTAVLILIAYVCAIGYLTLMFRDSSQTGSPKILWYYRKIFTDREAAADIFKNIWLFIPLGGVLFRLYPKKRILLVPVVLSLLIECIQYFSGTGFCELDDIISNSIGGWIGFCIGKLIVDMKLIVNTHKNIGKERLAL